MHSGRVMCSPGGCLGFFDEDLASIKMGAQPNRLVHSDPSATDGFRTVGQPGPSAGAAGPFDRGPTQIGLAFGPDFTLSKPGVGRDKAMMILTNKMNRKAQRGWLDVICGLPPVHVIIGMKVLIGAGLMP